MRHRGLARGLFSGCLLFFAGMALAGLDPALQKAVDLHKQLQDLETLRQDLQSFQGKNRTFLEQARSVRKGNLIRSGITLGWEIVDGVKTPSGKIKELVDDTFSLGGKLLNKMLGDPEQKYKEFFMGKGYYEGRYENPPIAANLAMRYGKLHLLLAARSQAFAADLTRFDDDQPPIPGTESWWAPPDGGEEDGDTERLYRRLHILEQSSAGIDSFLTTELHRVEASLEFLRAEIEVHEENHAVDRQKVDRLLGELVVLDQRLEENYDQVEFLARAIRAVYQNVQAGIDLLESGVATKTAAMKEQRQAASSWLAEAQAALDGAQDAKSRERWQQEVANTRRFWAEGSWVCVMYQISRTGPASDSIGAKEKWIEGARKLAAQAQAALSTGEITDLDAYSWVIRTTQGVPTLRQLRERLAATRFAMKELRNEVLHRGGHLPPIPERPREPRLLLPRSLR